MKHVYLMAAMAIALAGCGTSPVMDYSKLSADQIKAMASDRSMSVECVIVAGVAGWGGGRVVRYSQDKGVSSGETSISTDENCKITATTAPKIPAK